LAHAAARAIVEAPARVYNPVLVYGGPGTGKTHLLHAIGWELHRRYPTARVVLTSGERFLRDLVRSIRQQRMGSFYQLYRSADVLLVDGIHTVAGKESTQEELLHTLNDLHDRDRQVVLSSDCPPKDIPGLSHRLRLRLESGLMAQIQPPDLETKLAILERKAEQERIALPDKVKIFLASKAYLSVREFEAVLYQLRAVSSVTGTPITIHLAQQVLRDLTPNRERRVTTDSIMRAVAAHFDLQPAQLKARCNAPRIAVPRQIAMYLTRELTGASLPEIARAFGGKHHTTVLHSIRKIERLRQQDQDLNNLIHKLIEALQ
jgi:chromosomal replication initiator protein